MTEHEITITVEGGMVTEVKGVPDGWRVVVKDYDTSVLFDDDTVETDQGGAFWRTTFSEAEG